MSATNAEYYEWPMRGYLEVVAIGKETRLGVDLSFELRQEIHAFVELYATLSSTSRHPHNRASEFIWLD